MQVGNLESAMESPLERTRVQELEFAQLAAADFRAVKHDAH